MCVDWFLPMCSYQNKYKLLSICSYYDKTVDEKHYQQTGYVAWKFVAWEKIWSWKLYNCLINLKNSYLMAVSGGGFLGLIIVMYLFPVTGSTGDI